jgi:hypothetical protein
MRLANRVVTLGIGSLLLSGTLFLGGCGEGGAPEGAREVAAGPALELLTPPSGPGGVDLAQSADPSLAVDPETGELVLAWVGTNDEDATGAWNLYVARSSDGGRSFSPAVRVNDLPGDVHPHAEGAPRLVAGPGTLAVFWNNRIEAEGRRFAASDLRFSRSTDGGRSWSPAASIQDPVEPAALPPRAHTFHGATWVGDSTLVVAWLDGRDRDARRLERAAAQGIPADAAARTPEAFTVEEDLHDGDATVFAAVSHDGGATWEPENRRISGATCPCCRVSLVPTPHGEMLGSWRRHFDGSVRDPVVARLEVAPREAEGLQETPLARVHEDGWVFHGCPHSGPALDVAPDGTVHVAWYTGAEGRLGVYHARSASASSNGARPAVVALPRGGAVVAANVDEEGARVIVLSQISPGGSLAARHPVPDSHGGTHPQLVRLPGGQVVVAWTESRLGVQRMRLARLELNPASPTEGEGEP